MSIFTHLINLVTHIVSTIVSLFPTWGWLYSPADEIGTIFNQINNSVGAWLPVGLIASLFFWGIAAEIAYGTVVSFVWVLNKVRGAG